MSELLEEFTAYFESSRVSGHPLDHEAGSRLFSLATPVAADVGGLLRTLSNKVLRSCVSTSWVKSDENTNSSRRSGGSTMTW